jgi:hypothetical protein
MKVRLPVGMCVHPFAQPSVVRLDHLSEKIR